MKEKALKTESKEQVRVKRIQSDAFQRDKNNSDCSMLQIDFAMGYNCEWSRGTVNLFTAALYLRDAPWKSYLIVNNSSEKYKDAVYCFLNRLSHECNQYDFGSFLAINSNGPTCEFKNKCVKILNSLCGWDRQGGQVSS